MADRCPRNNRPLQPSEFLRGIPRLSPDDLPCPPPPVLPCARPGRGLHYCQHIVSRTGAIRIVATKVNNVPPFQGGSIKRRHRDHIGPQFLEGTLEPPQILRLRQNGKVRIPTEFGRSVKHAGLAAHQHRTRCSAIEERTLSIGFGLKDASQARGQSARAWRSPATAPADSSGTIPPTLLRQVPRGWV